MHVSEQLRKRQAQNILNAFDYAHSLDIAFNYYVVLYLDDKISQAANTAFLKIMQKYRSWLGRKRQTHQTDCVPTYVYTHENPTGANHHVNICLYIPKELEAEFLEKLPIWIEKVQGPLEPAALMVKPLRPNGYKNVAFYIIKGIDPEFVDYFNLRRKYDEKGPQGTIHGTRASMSRNLGPTTIREAEFDPVRYSRRQRFRQRA